MMAMSGSVGFESEDKKDTKDLLERYVQCAEYLIDKCRDLSHITGAQKLERKCFAELKYLRSLSRRGGGFDVSHLRSSNLSHYLGVVHAAENLPEVTQILQAFRCPGRSEPLHVDVVAGQGHLWVKVIARKGQALHLIWAGQGQYGERDILLQAEDYVLCSTSHPVNFVDPKVVFAFYNGVTVDMVRAFIKANVIVLGNKVEVDADIQEKLTKIGIDTDSDSESDSDSVTVDELENEGRMPSEHCLSNILKDNHLQTTGMPTDVGLAISSVDESGGTQLENSKLDLQKSETENAKMNFDQLQDRSPKAQSDICLLDVSTDLSSRNLVRVCPIDSIVTQKTQNCSSSTSESIDSNIFLVESPKTQTKEQSEKTNNNRLNISSIGPSHESNMSDDVNLSNIQFQTPIEWQNESIKNKVQRSDKWDSGSGYVTSFIERELLTFPLVNYALLDSVLMKNKENTVENILRVNLDITALITLVSAVSHGGCFFEFKEKILSEQAAEERQEPVLPRLESFLKGKELYACDTAIESFQTILNTLGGNAEKVRSATLMETLNVVKDNPSFRTSTLPNTGKIKDRSKIIFGTGDSLRAVTVTANSGFVRAAEHQGVLFAVFLHASRALTEEKEKTAKRISKADCSSD